MEKGDIVLVNFPFTDFSGNKNRPALTLFSDELDVTVAFISTQLKWKEQTDILLQPSKGNGLKKESLLRLSKLATVERALVLGLLGKIENTALEQVNKNLRQLFGLD